jgi:hypothetical protein
MPGDVQEAVEERVQNVSAHVAQRKEAEDASFFFESMNRGLQVCDRDVKIRPLRSSVVLKF